MQKKRTKNKKMSVISPVQSTNLWRQSRGYKNVTVNVDLYSTWLHSASECMEYSSNKNILRVHRKLSVLRSGSQRSSQNKFRVISPATVKAPHVTFWNRGTTRSLLRWEGLVENIWDWNERAEGVMDLQISATDCTATVTVTLRLFTTRHKETAVQCTT